MLLPAPFGPSRPTAPGREFGGDITQRPLLAVADADAVKGDNGRHWANYTFESFGSFEASEAFEIGRRAEAESIGAIAEEKDHVRHMLVERQAEFGGAGPQVVARDGASKGFVFHPLQHR